MARRFYLDPIRQLLREIREVRYGARSQIESRERRGLAAHLAREFDLLNAALCQTQNELERACAAAEGKVLDRTRNLFGMVRQLEKTAQTDDLTNLVNRASFNNHLKMLFEQSENHGADLACLMIDIDNFKFINDSLGHVVGDDVLTFVGRLLRACIRPGDVAARYGGDEFVLLLPMCSHAQAREVAERIRTLFNHEISRFSSADLLEQSSRILGLSIGLASINHHKPPSAQKLLEYADKALYKAKNNGRNTVIAQ